MGKIKLVFRACIFSLCVFVLSIADASTDSSESSTSPNRNPNVEKGSESQVSLVLERLDALERKFLEEMNRQFKSSEKNWNEQFKSLKKQLEDIKNENSVNEDVWLLTPPLRGRRGQKGEKGDSAGFRDYQPISRRQPTPVSLTTNTTKEINWEMNRPGENWIVAKGISRWDPNGRWGNPQFCPPAKFVTAHKFTYFSNSGLTEIQLTCTNKHNTNTRENDHVLRLKSADEPEVNVIGEEWDIRNSGNRTNFAEGFSLNRRVVERRGAAPEIRIISKNHDMIYHGQNAETSALNSSGIVTKCPENHAICGLIPMMDNAELGILSAIGFKCCDICTPEEKWVTVYQFNNTNSSNQTVQFNSTVGLQQRSQILNSTNLNLESAVDSAGISPSDFYKEFAAALGKSDATGFDWNSTGFSNLTEETNLTKTLTCEAQSSCVFQQLVGQCGNVRVPVDKFCQGSAPIGSRMPDSCTDSRVTSCSDVMETLSSPRSKKQTIYPHGNTTKVQVPCDFETDGGGWTVIQKRSRGPREEFKKNWTEYAKGFGSSDGNFWIGLENIRALTKNGDQELRIELEDFEGEKRWAKYSRFSISDASDFYRLSISGFYRNSTAGDGFTNSAYAEGLLNGMRFQTEDKNNGASCASSFYGGWWFNSCGARSFLNGRYRERGETFSSLEGIHWWTWKGNEYSLAKTEMKIRKKK